MNNRILCALGAGFLIAALAASCADARVPLSKNDGDASADTDSDTDTDTGADVDTDTDSDAECTVDTIEPFEASDLPTGWEVENFDDDAYGYEWTWSDADNSTGGAGGYWWIDGEFPVAFDDRLVSATFTRGVCPEVVLSFSHDFAQEGGTDFGYIQIQVDGGTWQTVDTLSSSASGAYEVDISSYLSNSDSEFRIRFRYVANNNFYWKVDDFTLLGGNP